MLASLDTPTSSRRGRRITIDVLDLDDRADRPGDDTVAAATLAALARAAALLRAAGLDVEVRKGRITPENLGRARCAGHAPTVRVNGRDVAPATGTPAACAGNQGDVSWAMTVDAIVSEILAAGSPTAVRALRHREAAPVPCCSRDTVVPCCAG